MGILKRNMQSKQSITLEEGQNYLSILSIKNVTKYEEAIKEYTTKKCRK